MTYHNRYSDSGLFKTVDPAQYQRMFCSQPGALFLAQPCLDFGDARDLCVPGPPICSDDMLYPFAGTIGREPDFGQLAAGKLLWSKVFEQAAAAKQRLTEQREVIEVPSDNSVRLRDSDSPHKQNVDDDEERKGTELSLSDNDPIEYDAEGHLKGPFEVVRKKQDTKFSTRQDVVNKTLIRSLKKHYTQAFKESSKRYSVRGSGPAKQGVLLSKFVNACITRASIWLPTGDSSQ